MFQRSEFCYVWVLPGLAIVLICLIIFLFDYFILLFGIFIL